MKIVVLDGYTENPGDLSWEPLEKLGEVVVYDRTSYVDTPVIAERLGNADIAVINKTPISRQPWTLRQKTSLMQNRCEGSSQKRSMAYNCN